MENSLSVSSVFALARMQLQSGIFWTPNVQYKSNLLCYRNSCSRSFFLSFMPWHFSFFLKHLQFIFFSLSRRNFDSYSIQKKSTWPSGMKVTKWMVSIVSKSIWCNWPISNFCCIGPVLLVFKSPFHSPNRPHHPFSFSPNTNFPISPRACDVLIYVENCVAHCQSIGARHASVERGRFNLAEIDQKFFPGIICRLTQPHLPLFYFGSPKRRAKTPRRLCAHYARPSDIKCQAKMPIYSWPLLFLSSRADEHACNRAHHKTESGATLILSAGRKKDHSLSLASALL